MTSITIRDVSDGLARKLKARAERNRRSLQGELIVILEEAIAPHAAAEPETNYRTATKAQSNTLQPEPRISGSMTIQELWERGRKLGLKTPNESADIIRKLRDERYGR